MTDEDLGPMGATAAFAPGRVNLIGDHTDYTGGYAMPIAIQLGTEMTYLRDPSSTVVELASSADRERARVPISIPDDSFEIAMVLPEWGRYLAGVLAVLRPPSGGKGNLHSDLPIRAGLSSSASLELALCLALGAGCPEQPAELARLAQRAEHLAGGVETGILDQLAIASAEAGHAMLLDCRSLAIRQVSVPTDAELVVVHCGVTRSVSGAGSVYPERQRQCAMAEAEIGPLRDASLREVDKVCDPLVRKRARHVVSENARVLAFAGALEHGDLCAAGQLMSESHRSLSSDFGVSLPELDQLVSWLEENEGVLGARLTGAGMGGCAVALTRPGALGEVLGQRPHWVVRPSDGARLR